MSEEFQITVGGISIPLFEGAYGRATVVVGGTVEAEYVLNAGNVTVSPTFVNQQAAVEIEYAALPGAVFRQTLVAQVLPVALEYQLNPGNAASDTLIPQGNPIVLEYVATSGIVIPSSTIVSQTGPVVVEYVANAGHVTADPQEITQQSQIDLVYDVSAGAVSSDPKEIQQTDAIGLSYQLNPGVTALEREVAGNTLYLEYVLQPGLVLATDTDVFQDGALELEYVLNPGAIITSDTDVLQVSPIVLEYFAVPGITARDIGVVQQQPIFLEYQLNAGVVEKEVVVRQQLAVGLEYRLLPGVVVVSSTNVVQQNPVIVEYVAAAGEVTSPQAIIVDGDVARLEYTVNLGLINIGQDPTCIWWTPRDCIDVILANEIIRKQPSEDIWVAMDFAFRMNPDEQITNVLSIDDQGTGIVYTPGTVEPSLPTRVKVGVAGGDDGENVRLEFIVRTSEARTLEGDGFLYVRDRL